MNFAIVPFHDWRKIILEGSRTRDAHFIEEFSKLKNSKTLIINRPSTIIEILFKKKLNLIRGKIIIKNKNFKLYRISTNLYVVDYISTDILGQVINGHNWFIKQYENKKYVKFISHSLEYIGIKEDYHLINQNIFANKLSNCLEPKLSIFDAWDNFMKFKVYSKSFKEIKGGYKNFAINCNFWITNSKENIDYYEEVFNPKSIYLVKNGVDVERFTNIEDNQTPKDIADIPRPIVGFGGKISHLIDVNLLNETMKISKDCSFVFVGQILNNAIFRDISKTKNFYYLGDKHYDEYPEYVSAFDICIIPYIVNEIQKTGANTIKVYEYLATGKKVVGTNSNGLEDLNEFVYIVQNPKEFAFELCNKINEKSKLNLKEHSWKKKTQNIIDLIAKHED